MAWKENDMRTELFAASMDELAEKRILLNVLRDAMDSLMPEERELAMKVFGEEMSVYEYARLAGGNTESDIDKYVSGVRVYEDRFEWLLNLNPDARGELDDAGSPVYFKKITVTPDDEREWFKTRPQWSKSNKYAELEARIYI